MSALPLAWHSLANRRGTVLLTVCSIAVSVALLLGVQKVRGAAREGFASTVSGVDLVVGARSGPVNLLLYSVFRIGDATANVSWSSYQLVARHRDVAWTIPLSLGDSHRGFRVLGTTGAYFDHYRVAGGRPLEFTAGGRFNVPNDAVIGADVAAELRYEVGSVLAIAHGTADVSFAAHDEAPFRVAGILARTGTPVDRTVHIALADMTALHAEDVVPAHPDSITAFMVGMRDRAALLTMQRALNDYRAEPLQAIIPGVALKQLWDVVGIADRALLLIAAFVVLAGLLGMLTAILVSLQERRREMAILRSVGARPQHVFALLVSEAGLLALAGVLVGAGLCDALLAAGQGFFARHGIFVPVSGLTMTEAAVLAGIVAAGLLMGLLPAWRAYRNTLADGLTIRI